MHFIETVQREMPKCGQAFMNIQKNQVKLTGLSDEQNKDTRKILQKESKNAEKRDSAWILPLYLVTLLSYTDICHLICELGK